MRGKVIFVNKIWITALQSFLEDLSQRQHTPSYIAQKISILENNDKLIFYFRDLSQVDIFILNLVFDLLLLRKSQKVMILEQHEIFTPLNDIRTKKIILEINKLGSSIQILINGGTNMDREINYRYLKDQIQSYVLDKPYNFITEKKITHVIDDVIIDLVLDKQLVHVIHSMFLNAEESIDKGFISQLKAAMLTNQRNRIIIYRDPEKSRKINKLFRKYFVD